MDTIKRVIYEHKNELIKISMVLLVLTVFGTVLHDVILYFGANDPEMTIFPLATFMYTIGMAGVSVLFLAIYEQNHFNLSISMGQTRKQYFNETAIFYFSFFLIAEILHALVNKLEMLKLELLYKGKYELELDMSSMFKPHKIVLFAVGVTILGLFIMAIIMKFGKVAYWVLYFGFIFGMTGISRFSDNISESAIFQFIIINLNKYTLFGVFCVIFVALLLISRKIIMNQQVTL